MSAGGIKKAMFPAWNGGQGFKICFIMKIYKEENLQNFEFWGGAKINAAQLTAQQFDEVESIMEDIYPDGVDETFINDFLVRV